MSNVVKDQFLSEATERFGQLRKLPRSLSLYDLQDGNARIYIRYSKKHGPKQTFYGLRDIDLRQLEGQNAFVCFLWNEQESPIFVPYRDFEDVFATISPAGDGQYKAQIHLEEDGIKLYIAGAGRFSIDSYIGWEPLTDSIDSAGIRVPVLSHPQVQTLLGAIGTRKGYDVWIPQNDRSALDWSLAQKFTMLSKAPVFSNVLDDILPYIDVIWFSHATPHVTAFFEVEHSTPVYSGLLRLNDVRLLMPANRTTYSIVANDERRSTFVRQINRPTFQLSRLQEHCSFLEYRNVFLWHYRSLSGREGGTNS